MQQDILINGVAFSAVPLMLVTFGNRCTVVANLIRNLRDEVFAEHIWWQDTERFLDQISRLRDRLRLIGIIQSFAPIAFMLAFLAMIVVYFDQPDLVSMLFIRSILLQMISMLMFRREIHIANMALDVHILELK